MSITVGQEPPILNYNKLSRFSQWLFYLIIGIGLMISALLWHALQIHSEEHVNHTTQRQIAYLTANLAEPRLRISALKEMSKHQIAHFLLTNYPNESPMLASTNNELETAEFESFLSYVALGICLTITLLFASATRFALVARKRAQWLDQANRELTTEIAERLQAEETKQQLEIALLHGQKLQAIGTLAGGIAHDFNNIIYAIIGYTEMAQEDVEKDSLVYKNLSKVLEASHRAQDLVARLLTFGRHHQHHQLSPLPLKMAFENALSLLKPTIPASVTINFKVASQEPCIILGNQTQLHQVIVNIITNAVDAMEGEGTITINLDYVMMCSTLLHQFPELTGHDDNYCKITISDTGHGMDQPTLDRIFEPFFTTKEVGKGTGLGLATAHTIINEHHGEIRVTSQLGKGTTFTILIPEYKENQDG